MAVDSVRDPVNGVPFKSSDNSNSITNGASLAETFDTFLTLLTTQLQYQNPLDPMDTSEFTNQLVQFSGVEQAINTNKKLDSLINLQTDQQINDAAGYIGKNVSADSIILMLKDGQSNINYDLGANSKSTSIMIIDEQGNTVRTLDGDTEVGHHELVWDGKDEDGKQVDDGLYGFLVTALDSDGNPVPLVQGTTGKVTGVKKVDDEVTLEIDDLEIALKDVLGVSE